MSSSINEFLCFLNASYVCTQAKLPWKLAQQVSIAMFPNTYNLFSEGSNILVNQQDTSKVSNFEQFKR